MRVGPAKFSKPQWEFISCKARFKLWRASRRQGKTNAAEFDHIKYSLENKGTTSWYVAQDLALCTEMNIPLFNEMVPQKLISKYDKQARRFNLINDSKFYFKTANSSDSLRGRKVHRLTCEEPTYWQNGSDIYHNILRPQLADTMGGCAILFTPPTQKAPKGSEWVRRLELSYLDEIKNGNPDYAVFHNTIWDSPYISDTEKKNLEAMTDPATWACEYLATYNDQQGQVYWEYEPLTHKRIIDTTEPIITRIRGIDWGIADNTACVWAVLLPGNRVYFEDEYVDNNKDVPSHATQIKSKTQFKPQYTILDSACWARDASLSSVAKRFAAEGINCVAGTKDLDGSISDMKQMFSNGNIIIHPQCIKLLQAITDWQHGLHEPDVLAAARYAVDALIRTGKLLPPIKRVIQKSPIDIFVEQEGLIKRMEKMNHRLSYMNKNIGGGASFKIY